MIRNTVAKESRAPGWKRLPNCAAPTSIISNSIALIVFGWLSSWGMCVTLAETDAAMLRVLQADRDVNDGFDNVIRNPRFRDPIRGVEHSFPLASFSDLLRLDPRYNWRGERDAAYWQKIAEAPRGKKVRLSPKLDHRNLNWPDTLDCTY
jgi:hypothetical protein